MIKSVFCLAKKRSSDGDAAPNKPRPIPATQKLLANTAVFFFLQIKITSRILSLRIAMQSNNPTALQRRRSVSESEVLNKKIRFQDLKDLRSDNNIEDMKSDEE